MITFHPAARRTSSGQFIPMVTLRAERGRMVGSKLQQHGNAFETEADAVAHAMVAALRVACAYPEIMTVARTA